MTAKAWYHEAMIRVRIGGQDEKPAEVTGHKAAMIAKEYMAANFPGEDWKVAGCDPVGNSLGFYVYFTK